MAQRKKSRKVVRKPYTNFEGKASYYLRRELANRDLTYKDLAGMLEGSQTLGNSRRKRTERAVLQKLVRGKFSADFLLAALVAMDIKEVDVSVILASKWIDKRRKAEPAQTAGKITKKSKPRLNRGRFDSAFLTADDSARTIGKVYPRNWNGPAF